jgi:predicted nucleic acid-binding protein
MIAFFDTSVHIPLLSGMLSWDTLLQEVGLCPVRLSPVVASELLRGVSGPDHRQVETLVRQLVPLDPPSWRRCWYEAGRLLPKIFPDHEAVGLARLQNDCLLALTARYTGALFLAADGHFATIRRYVPFPLRLLQQKNTPGSRASKKP